MLRKAPRALAATLAAVVLVLAAAPATLAQPTEDEYARLQRQLDQTRRKVAEAEKRERGLRRDITDADARRHALEEEVEELSAELSSAQGRLDVAEMVLGRTQQRLTAKTDELWDALQDLQAANTALRARAEQVYKSGPASFVDFLLGALDFRDLVSRAEFLSHVFRSDEEKIRTIRDSKERIASERQEIAELRQRALAQVGAVAHKRNTVYRVRGAMEARRRDLVGELKKKYATLEDVQQDKASYLRQQRELEQESARIASFLRGRTGGKATVGPGGMVWPTDGELSSGFGWRTHPIFGTRRFHAGIDIAASSGQTVVAAADGTVIYAGPKGGYGTVVILDHGGGLATLYAHLSGIGAGEGTKLARSKPLGRVGCTGYCTGPHLHFEVRVNGEPQNPSRWLP